jgi:thioredoxin reductase (NADPH)
MFSTDIAIIGGGPVGIFAAFQAGMLGMKAHLFESSNALGGQCAALYAEKPIYDIPGLPEVKAIDLVQNLIKQASPFKPQYHTLAEVIHLSRQEGRWLLESSSHLKVAAKAVLITAGGGLLVPNKPPLEKISEFELSGSIAYKVDSIEEYRDKDVLIAGGRDSAADWVNSLCGIARKIFFVHRREKFKCTLSSLEKITEACEKGLVEMICPAQILGIEGENGVIEKVKIGFPDKSEREVLVDKVLFFFGLKTALGPIGSWGIKLHSGRIIVEQETCQTNLSGIYAAGDIAFYPGKLKLILSGFSEVATALHHAYSEVFPGQAMHLQHSTDKGLPSA